MNSEKIRSIWFLLSAGLFLAGLVISLIAAPGGFTVGFVGGGALVLVNAMLSAWRTKRTDFRSRGKAMVYVILGFYVRLALMGVCLYYLIAVAGVHPLGLVAGVSVMPAGLLAMLALMYLANRRPREV